MATNTFAAWSSQCFLISRFYWIPCGFLSPKDMCRGYSLNLHRIRLLLLQFEPAFSMFFSLHMLGDIYGHCFACLPLPSPFLHLPVLWLYKPSGLSNEEANPPACFVCLQLQLPWAQPPLSTWIILFKMPLALPFCNISDGTQAEQACCAWGVQNCM